MRFHSSRVPVIALIALILSLFIAPVSRAHHGWGWATDTEFEITGQITAAKLGNPHGLVTIEVKGDLWDVEVGQPWRNRNAGLSDAMFAIGRAMTVHGHRSAKKSERLVKAERVVFDGTSYDLYPDRES